MSRTAAPDGPIAGIDVGGTFTDLVMLDPATGAVRIAKVPSTPRNQAAGVMAALSEAEADLATLALIVHGTTTTTNAVLERKLAKTGLITTEGFRDILELGRRTRPQAYGMTGTFTPVIPRDLRLEVPERMDAQGRVVRALDEAAVASAARRLLDAGCVSVVIHFLHAYANPEHERRAARIVADLWPNGHVTMGHALLSESREFERGVTAAINASVQPILQRYVDRLSRDLVAGGYRGELLVMNGNGGMVSAPLVSREAAKTVMSGPASGVMAAAHTGRRAGFRDLITYDMGGTSSDVALIRDATPPVSSEIEVEYAMPVHVPMVDVRTVGAGGGSIARLGPSGLLEVGPDSAGADPGPICYGRGGSDPTITDANMLLGRLDPGRLKSVEGGVTLATVREMFERRLGAPLGLDATGAAEAVLRVANTRMAGAIRMVSLSLGADPRDFALFAFGGAGPLHSGALARELGIPTILIPARPGITNALGCVVADLRQDYVNTLTVPLEDLDEAALRAIFARHRADGAAFLDRQRIEIRETRFLHALDMQFIGQTHLLRVTLEGPEITREALRAKFEKVYHDRFQVRLAQIRPRLVNVITSVIGVRPDPDLGGLIDPGARGSLAGALVETRPVWVGGWRDVPVYRRERLPLDVTLTGPAIIEQMDTTLVVEPGDRVRGDVHGNLIVEIA